MKYDTRILISTFPKTFQKFVTLEEERKKKDALCGNSGWESCTCALECRVCEEKKQQWSQRKGEKIQTNRSKHRETMYRQKLSMTEHLCLYTPPQVRVITKDRETQKKRPKVDAFFFPSIKWHTLFMVTFHCLDPQALCVPGGVF